MDGYCFGRQYSNPYGTCDSVVVQPIKIIFKNFVVPIERTSSQLILLGQRCEGRRECLDSENGQIFWSVVSQNSCQFDRYDVLYEGTAIKSRKNHAMLTVFTVTTQETTFALAKTIEFNLRGYIMTQMNKIPNLFIQKIQRGRIFKAR